MRPFWVSSPKRPAGRAFTPRRGSSLPRAASGTVGLWPPAQGALSRRCLTCRCRPTADWFEPAYWRSQPYARFGVVVNDAMQPVDAAGEPLYPNLWAAGGLLAGADRIGEGCREGVDLATAWCAVNSLTLPALLPMLQ